MMILDAKLSQLPSMLWARSIKKRMGMSYGKIQKEFSLDSEKANPNFWPQCSRCIYKNHRGAKVRDKNFIERIEESLPGTRRLLTHPLWKILENPNSSSQQLLKYAEDLDIDIKQKIFVLDKRDGAYKRRELKRVRELKYISMRNNLDALACLLILIREFEIKELVDPYTVCKWEAHYLLGRIGLFSPVKDLASSIYEYMYPSFISKNYPLPPSFETFFSMHMPEYFQPPPYKNIDLLLTVNRYMLEVMGNKNIVSRDEEDQLKFLFLVDSSGKKREILLMLKDFNLNFDHLSSDKKIPEPLQYVMRMMKGDSRQYLSGRSFVYGQKPYVVD